MKTTTVREFGKNMDEKETFYVEPKEMSKWARILNKKIQNW